MSDNNSNTSDSTGAEDFKKELQAQIDKIDNAIAALPDGEIGDLQELDRNVSDLCNRLENAPRDIAQESEPLMSQMISRLEELEQKLRSHQDELNLAGAVNTGQDQEQAKNNADETGNSADDQ